ncbi:molecular chaperone [Christiangramia echinicola]|uniref:P pilus assembly protein, chaperone PapD n=1 Tax=Christiangramia echinicola TaxID=279359 RepID=A0A1H1RY09_9FLAO|nr:molecular chaperone [Christiangramia echinicola]SDS40631.1 P pilus assembly protein, chaperone PapD [Christiangramia echinicola]
MHSKLPTTLLLLTVIIFSSFGFAQGNLMIMPKRLVFDGSQRAQEINLVNTGKDSATYAISFIQYKMTEDGDFQEITEPELNQRFAHDYLRYYPRRVSLGPDEAQTVRVQITRSSSLETGEYRSHFYFRAVEEQTALGVEDQEESDGISINIKTVFGISIPVIIRNGESTTELDLTNLQLEESGDNYSLSMTINRKGNMSVYGNLMVEYISPEGISTEIQKVKGISVYTPNLKRNFSLNIQNSEGFDFEKGELKVTYTSDSGGKLAVKTLNLE